jgi:polyisoprenoid-binding protein YceI
MGILCYNQNKKNKPMKTKWKLDPAHSEVTFKVKHMMITNVSGTFNEFNVETTTENDDFTKADVTFTAKTASVDTKSEQRDTHLRSADFFDAEKYPEIKFKPTRYEKISDDELKIQGDLTIRGITKNIALNAEFGGVKKDPWGQTKAGFTIDGKINRRDWGLNWNAVLEAGGVMVSEDVKVHGEIQLVRE